MQKDQGDKNLQSTFNDNLSKNNEIKVDHLISLVGGNPLPIVVSALLLLKGTGKLWLVHSKDSAKIAECIKEVLHKKQEDIKFELVELDSESNSQNIRIKIKENILNKLPKEGISIGLDYTGGTKVMAAITYNEFVNFDFGNNIPFASYLDPRKHLLRVEQELQREPGKPKNIPLGKSALVSLKDTVDLHDWKLESDSPISSPDIKLPETAQKIAKLCASEEGFKKWKEWRDSQLNKCRKENSRAWLNKTKLQEKTFSIKDSSNLLKPIFDELLRELGLPSEQTEIESIQEKVGKEKEFCKWLDGLWLEYAVANALLPLKEDPDIKLDDIWHSVKTIKPEFEVDIVASRGHQLFLISCTTDDKKDLNKSKAIEIFYRGRQLGGDEARVCLVCCFDSEQLKEEFKNALGSEIKVIGLLELGDLQASLKNWIKQEMAKECI